MSLIITTRQLIKINNLYIKYDLNADYLYGVDKSLQNLWILTLVVEAYKSDEALQEIEAQVLNNRRELAGSVYMIIEDKLEIPHWPYSWVKEALLTIRLVYNNIKDFLTCVRECDLSLFLRNLDFNWQGFINPRQTVLQALKSRALSKIEKFELSCMYLFDEKIIITYYKELTPNIQDWYLSRETHAEEFQHNLFIYFWIWIITGNNCKLRELVTPKFSARRDNNEYTSTNICFVCYFVLVFRLEIGIQYLIEKLSPPKAYIKKAIEVILRDSRISRINILLYLICQLDDQELVNGYAFKILTNLVSNSRWHGIFISYFNVLKNYVENQNYFELLSLVVLNLKELIYVEGVNGKYFAIFRDFIEFIPIGAKKFISDDKIQYAKFIFSLFCIRNKNFLDLLISIYVNAYDDYGEDNYREVAFMFINRLAGIFLHCSNKCMKRFLILLMISEEIIIDLKRKLDYRLNPQTYIERKCRILEENQPFKEFNLEVCFITEENSIQWKFLYIEKEEFIIFWIITSNMLKRNCPVTLADNLKFILKINCF